VTELDQRGEFHLERHPPGTAPASNSFSAKTVDKVGSQANNPDVLRAHGKEAVHTTAESTLRGATSADVHTGLGKPLVGETSVETRHDGAHGRKNQRAGMEGTGASMEDRSAKGKFPDQRGYEKEHNMRGLRGDKGDRSAANMRPEPAETAAAESVTKRNA
jgi:hypothetical protein